MDSSGSSSSSNEAQEALKPNTTTETETKGQKRKRTDSSESKVELEIMDKELTAPEKVMNNKLVMAKIAEKLPAWCLLSLRQTCTLWNSNFIPQLKKSAPPVWLNSRRLAGKVRQVADFTDMLRSTPRSEIPFNSFVVHLNNESGGVAHPHRSHLDGFIEFVQEFGNTVWKLQLNCRQQTDHPLSSQLRKIIFDYTPEVIDLDLSLESFGPVVESTTSTLTSTLPTPLKLKRLSVTAALETRSVVDPGFGNLICDVIQNAEGLEKLNCFDGRRAPEFIHEPGNHLVGPILNRLLTLQHNNKLKTLKLAILLTSAEFTVLIGLGGRRTLSTPPKSILSLTSFSTHLARRGIPDTSTEPQGVEDFRLLHDFLVTQSPTLKKLAICFEGDPEYEPEFCVVLPRMEHLEQLAIQHSTLRADELQFTNNWTEGIVDAFPLLSKFSYEYDPDDVDGLSFSDAVDVGRVSHPGVTSFSFHSKVQEYSTFSHFGPVFPSLTRLDLNMYAGGHKIDTHIDVKEFAKLWTTWPNLTAVQLCWEGPGVVDLDLDAFICGVPRPGLEALRQKLDLTVRPTAASLEGMVEEFKIRPGIVDLTHLKDLTITFDRYTVVPAIGKAYIRPQLTDMGGYFGLALATPTLQKVFISGHGKNLLSEQCLTYIRSVFGPLVLIEL